MKNALTRRGLVKAAPAAIVSTGLPALAAGSDDRLFDLYRRLAPLAALAAEADRRVIALDAAYDRIMPGIPDALIVRPGDRHAMKRRPEMKDGKPTGRFEYDVDIETANRQLAYWSDWPECDREVLRQHCPGTEASLDMMLARLREIVDSYVPWEAARRAAWLASGVSEAQDAAEEAHARCGEIVNEIASCPATTLAGVMLKARAAMPCFGATAVEAEEALDEAIDEQTGGERLALSILEDLLRMAQRNAAGGLDA